MNTENKNTFDRPHHPFSPSSLQSREACPKYTNRQGEVHEAALIGTMQHDMAESLKDNPKLADFQAAAVAECVDFCEKRARLYPGSQVLKEVYLPIDDAWITTPTAAFQGTTAGYIDFAVVSEDQKFAEIVDYKYGRNIVEEAKNNLQGIAYALGLLKMFPGLTSIRVWFIMPHADHTSDYIFTREMFDDMRLRVNVVVGRANEAHKNDGDFSTASPNTSACLFCGHIGVCPKVAERVISLGKKYRPLEIPADVTPSIIADPKQAAIGLRLAAVVSTWAEAFKRQATAKTIDREDFIPEGYILVTSTKRKVTNPIQLGKIARKFLPRNQWKFIQALYELPLGKVEDLINTAAPRGSKETTVGEFGAAALEAGVIEQGEPFAFLRQSQKTDSGKTAKK